jgi:hypothetical protein
MLIFTIIMFFFGGIRTLSQHVKLVKEEKSSSLILASIIVSITYWIAFIWFLNYVLNII